jgi:hypothetical protein
MNQTFSAAAAGGRKHQCVFSLAAAALLLTLSVGTATAAATGEFLFLYNSGEGAGGIWGVDVTGTNFFGIEPGNGDGGFSTTNPPYPNPWIEDFTQARANGRIAFYSVMNPNDSGRIYVENGDGTGVLQVTFHNPSVSFNQPDWQPAISVDGSKVAYANSENIAPPGSISSNENCSGSQNTALWVVNSDGTNPHVVRQPNYGFTSYCNVGTIYGAAWSPDGTKLAVKDGMGNGNSNCANEVIVMNADGSNPVAINCNNNWGVPTMGLDWSPDGTKLAVDVACGGVGDEPNCWAVNIYNTSTWSVEYTISSFNNYVIRFSPDSSLLAYFNNNTNTIDILNYTTGGTLVSSVNVAGYNAHPGQLVWGSGSPGTLSKMTLAVPSLYLNACTDYEVQLYPSLYNTAGVLVNHGYSGVNGIINSGDGDSWHVDGFGNAYYNQTRGSATGTLQLTNMGVSSNTIPMTLDSTCTCQAAGSGITVTRGGFRYVTSAQDQFVQTLAVTNNTGSTVSGPINVVIESLTSTATLTNPGGTTGCTSPGSPYVILVPSGSSLAAGQSASVSLDFRDPSLAGFTYSTAVTIGAGAP